MSATRFSTVSAPTVAALKYERPSPTGKVGHLFFPTLPFPVILTEHGEVFVSGQPDTRVIDLTTGKEIVLSTTEIQVPATLAVQIQELLDLKLRMAQAVSPFFPSPHS